MTLCFDKDNAPLAKLLVTIIGNISGVKPTATAIAKKNASPQAPLVKPLIKKTIGNKIITIRNKNLLTFAKPKSKLVFPRCVVAFLAISPKNVCCPVFKIIAFPCPLKTSVPINTRSCISNAETSVC